MIKKININFISDIPTGDASPASSIAESVNDSPPVNNVKN
jgi:hypothetical protein